MKNPKFSDWLREALLFVKLGPSVWIGYCLFVGILLIVGKISPALGIFSCVTCLFVGVGIAKYIDLRAWSENPVGFYWAVNKSLPLAVIAAIGIVVSWFVFMAIANIVSGEFYKIGQFFFHWELTPENLNRNTMREIAGWIYAYANISLIFVLLMLTTFVGWFTHPLMLFEDFTWSQAKEKNDRAVSRNQNALYKMLGFIFFEAFLCMTITPLLTPVLYMLVSTLMYVSYKSIFETAR